MPLNHKQEDLVLDIAYAVRDAEGRLSPELAQRISSSPLVDKEFTQFIQFSLIPALSEKELFNLTFSLMKENINKNETLLSKPGDLTTLLYDQYRKMSGFIPAHETAPINALHWCLVQSIKNPLPFIEAAELLDRRYGGKHAPVMNAAVKSDHEPQVDRYTFKETIDKASTRLEQALTGIAIDPTRLEQAMRLTKIKGELAKELEERVVMNRERKEEKHSFVSILSDQLKNPLNKNVSPNEIISKIVNDNDFKFKDIIAGIKSNRVKTHLIEICGGEKRLDELARSLDNKKSPALQKK